MFKKLKIKLNTWYGIELLNIRFKSLANSNGRITRLKMSNLADLKKIVLALQEQLKTVATNDKIDDLINTINEKDLKINDLEDRIKELENKYILLVREIDDNDSYTRRQKLRIVGIPDEAHESGASCLTKVKEEISKLDLPLNLDVAIDRAHRIGKK